MATAIYDPYRPLMVAQLWPGDWSGWPTGALPPCFAIARGQAQLGKSGYTLHISRERIHRIDDRATTFAYQPYDSEKLQDLRLKYNFDALLGGNASEITTLAILNDWTRCQWKHGPSKNVNFLQFYAGDIIQRGMRGEQFSCQVAAMTFSQIVSAIGYQARLVSLFPYRGGPQHAVSEVWVNDLAKWVVFDTDFNLYYVSKCGVPLNVLELHKGLLNGRSGDIMIVKGLYRPETFDIEEVSEKPLLLPYYRYFFVDMRNDWMTNVYFRGHPKRSDQATLRWREE